MATLLLYQTPMLRIPRNYSGFSLLELLIVVGLVGTMAAVGLPILTGVSASIKLNQASRTVERELQGARLRAVSSNRALRVRTNCPTTGSVRAVEVLGTSADTATNRCALSAYPYPAPDNDIITRPNFDGPVSTLPPGATVTSAILQFQPDGTASQVVNDVVQTIRRR